MAIKFECEKCGAEIVVKYAKPGDEVPCRRCGAPAVVPGLEEIEEGLAPAFELRCGQCGEAVDAAALKPGESTPCPSCGAAVTFPDYSEFEKRKRFRRYVPCPACGATDSNVIIFWGLGATEAWLLRHHIDAVPVKCEKCGTRFDGLTGRPVDRELFYVKKYRSFTYALGLIVAFIFALIVIIKVFGRL
jgi:predicted nucleic acid-binding Zn ribbon protein